MLKFFYSALARIARALGAGGKTGPEPGGSADGLPVSASALSAASPAALVLLHRERLLGCALQLLDDAEAAQQVVFEAIEQALRSPLLLPLADAVPGAAIATPAETGPEALLRWLERLVVGLSLARLKALPSPGRALSSYDNWPALRDAEPSAADDRGPASAQRTAQALSALPPETRATVLLVVTQGRTLAEVADLLGCSEVTCRFWLSNGRKLLRRALQRDLVEDDAVSRESRVVLSPGALYDLRRSKKAAARA